MGSIENKSLTEAIILAGGFGTRLQSVVSDRPKALAEVSGRPFIEYQLEWLMQQGIRNVTLAVHYMAEQLQVFTEQWDNKKINLDKVNKNQIFFTDGENDVRKDCLDYFYITEGKIFGSYTVNLTDEENFDPEKNKEELIKICGHYVLSQTNFIKEIKLKTNNRLLNAKIVGHLDVELAMGKPIFEWNKIPLSKNLDHSNITLNIEDKVFTDGFCLNVGNPHIIFFVKDCFEHDLKILGPKIENNKLFPERTNVTFAQVDDRNNITVNVWERGAGLTKACGTAACATAVVLLATVVIMISIMLRFVDIRKEL